MISNAMKYCIVTGRQGSLLTEVEFQWVRTRCTAMLAPKWVLAATLESRAAPQPASPHSGTSPHQHKAHSLSNPDIITYPQVTKGFFLITFKLTLTHTKALRPRFSHSFIRKAPPSRKKPWPRKGSSGARRPSSRRMISSEPARRPARSPTSHPRCPCTCDALSYSLQGK